MIFTPKLVLLIVAMVCIAMVNIASYRYLGLFGLLVTLGSGEIVLKLIELAEKM